MNTAAHKTHFLELNRDQMSGWLAERDIKPYRAGQILRWVYQRQAASFSEMTDLGKPMRQQLDAAFSLERSTLIGTEVSKDGSRKFLFRLRDGAGIETVLIPERDHYTLCISSQVGCAQGCRFCLTAKAGFRRNLTRGEIVAQVRDVARMLGKNDSRRLTNIVLMGMGEPLANYRNVTSALHTLTDQEAGMGFASRRITLSTVGILPKLAHLAGDTTVNLAISLNAADNRTRDLLMPVNRKYPIEALIDACRRFPLKTGRRITFEYVLIEGVNDSSQSARRLAALLTPVRSKINLIPFNAHEGCDFKRPPESVVMQFQEILLRKNFTTIIRQSKGRDICAACGQLSARHLPPGNVTTDLTPNR